MYCWYHDFVFWYSTGLKQSQQDAHGHQKQSSKSVEDVQGFFESVVICKFGLNYLI